MPLQYPHLLTHRGLVLVADILVLDAEQRSALAVTRALGQQNLRVVTADCVSPTLAGSSKYSLANRVYPDPYETPLEFLDWFQSEVEQNSVRMVFPMTEVTTDLVMRHRHRWPNVTLPFADITTIDALADKIRLHQRASELGIAIPPTHYLDSPEAAQALLPSLQFPVVLKPYRSRIWLSDRWLATAVQIVHDESEYRRWIAVEPFKTHPYMVQGFIQGEGQGVFALYNQGQPQFFFAHRRLRERPPSGGVSVWSESALPNPALQHAAETLLTDAKWHGVAMVEFKVAPDGTPYLMEINTRFWGSLQLAIDAGANFPYALYQMASGQPVTPAQIKAGVRLRWLLGDVDNLYLTLKERRYSFLHKLLVLLRFFKPDFFHTKHEIDRMNDLRPAWYELKRYFSGN
ncbi:conserved hypothetical protein [gamma proteobacterium HdN1]|nr:conserved hypothetical protein [gamma proteobacterium HdN1]